MHTCIHSFIQWAECLFMSQAHRTKGPHKAYNVAPSQIETKLKTDNCYEGGVQSRLQMPLWVWGNGAPRKWHLSLDAQKDLSRQKEEQRWDLKVGDMAGGAQQRSERWDGQQLREGLEVLAKWRRGGTRSSASVSRSLAAGDQKKAEWSQLACGTGVGKLFL